MRSNIARTCPASSFPAPAPWLLAMGRLLGLIEEGDDVVELLRGQVLERRHRRRRVDQRARDRLTRQPIADLRQVRPRPGVAVLPDLVTPQAAALRPRPLARFVFAQQRPPPAHPPGRRALSHPRRVTRGGALL